MSAALLQAKVIRLLHRYDAHYLHPSIATSSILAVRPQKLSMKFPGVEFDDGLGCVSPVSLEQLAHCVGRACVEMALDEPTPPTRQNHFVFQSFGTPQINDEIRIMANATQEGAEAYSISCFITSMQRDRVVRVAMVTSSLILNPIEIQRPRPSRRRRRAVPAAADAPLPQSAPEEDAALHQEADPAAAASPPPAEEHVAPHQEDAGAAAAAPLQLLEDEDPEDRSSPEPSVIVVRGPTSAPMVAAVPSQFLNPYRGDMDQPVTQRYMLANVRASIPQNASALSRFLNRTGVQPVNIAHAEMFIKVQWHRTWVFYFDVQSDADRAKLDKHLVSEQTWFKKFDCNRCSHGDVFLAEAIPMKLHLKTVLMATWVYSSPNRASRFQNRRRAMASSEAIQKALEFERIKMNLKPMLNEDGKMMLRKVARESQNV